MIRREKSRREGDRKKKRQMCEKIGKSRFTVFFQWFVAPEGRKVGSLKRRARTAGQISDEKVHAVVARSTFPSQNVQNTKSARRCGAKHICKSKCTKRTTFRALLEVEILQKCAPLWREAHFQVKMLKTLGVRNTFWSSDVEFRKSARRCGVKHIVYQSLPNTIKFHGGLWKQFSGRKPPKIWALHEGLRFWSIFGPAKPLKSTQRPPWKPDGGHTEPQRAQIFGVFLPENGFQRLHGTLYQTPGVRIEPLLEAQMSSFEKGTPLWREAFLEIKIEFKGRQWKL